jgi:hypothetical protein
MRRFMLAAALPIVCVIAAVPAMASPPSIQFAAQGEIIDARRVDVEFRFRCTEWPPLEFLSEVWVSTEQTFARGSVDVNQIVCDGRWHTYIVPVATDSPTPLTEGLAVVSLGIHAEKMLLVDRVPG